VAKEVSPELMANLAMVELEETEEMDADGKIFKLSVIK
jgi:hypothetical protein